MTKASLKRQLLPGLKLTLTNSLLGPCNKQRTVHQVRSNDIVMITETGSHSHLAITPDEEVRGTSNGFQIVLKEGTETSRGVLDQDHIVAEYEWGWK